MAANPLLQFVPFNVAIGVSFWHEFAKRKLELYKLSDKAVTITAQYRTGSPALLFDNDSFPDVNAATTGPAATTVEFSLVNCNTQEEFRKLPVKELFDEHAKKLWASIKASANAQQWLAAPQTSLWSGLMLMYADLKKHEFRYLAACPALKWPGSAGPTVLSPASVLSKPVTAKLATILGSAPFVFLSKFDPEDVDAPATPAAASALPQPSVDGAVTVLISDPSDSMSHPGWPLRNLLLAIAAAYKGSVTKVNAICIRGCSAGGLALTVALPAVGWESAEFPGAVGFLGAEAGKPLQAKVVSLANTMDPVRLAESAARLNLQLMRWRMFPQLDLERLGATRCLLLGSGTLGCNVARALLGWGVRRITMLDNSRVAYSNPVRQSLFTFADSHSEGGMGRMKAEAAADRLREIFPGVESKAVVMTIPMPGHHVGKGDEQRCKKAVEDLTELVRSHDVIFLLSDSRECRWLPTLLGAALSKLVITVGLGFDSYVVMRHGVPGATERCGCYFCSDVVAPRDSITDRTLDQACTVTRPGLSMVASGLAVELMVSVLHHPDGVKASPTAEAMPPLGPVPHQLRGFLSQWNTLQLSGEASTSCVACCDSVLAEYHKRGFDFLLDAFNNPAYLEDLSGITELRRQAEEELSKEDGEGGSCLVATDDLDDF